jgi:hypothetical protein
MREVDFLLTPSAPGEAPRSLESTGDPVFNRAWTLLGVPCVNVPYGKGAHGLPLGVQLVGPFDGDRRCSAGRAGRRERWAGLVAVPRKEFALQARDLAPQRRELVARGPRLLDERVVGRAAVRGERRVRRAVALHGRVPALDQRLFLLPPRLDLAHAHALAFP